MEEWVIIYNDRIIQRFTIEDGQCLTIGRDDDADVVINNTAISRKHSSLELIKGEYYLTDLYSLNGTKVNGRQIVSSVPIQKNDLLEVGKFIMKPAEYLTGEEDAGSVSASPDSFNQTVYVSGIYKKSKLKKEKKPKKHNELIVIAGKVFPEKSLSLKGRGSIKAGTAISSDLVLSGWFIGNPQFFITHRDTGYYIVHSKGLHRTTKVNGKPLKKERKLYKKDVISVGSIKIQFN